MLGESRRRGTDAGGKEYAALDADTSRVPEVAAIKEVTRFL